MELKNGLGDRNFFGRKRAKGLSENKAILAVDLLPKFEFNSVEFLEKSKSFDSVILDIGFGQGESTFSGAVNNPRTLYLGVEMFLNGYANLLELIEKHFNKTGVWLENILIAPMDAMDLIATLPDEIFDRVQLLFPDPWPKKKHNKRRLVNVKNLFAIKRVLKNGGIFRFVSDIDDYNFWTLMMISKVENFAISYENIQDYDVAPEGWVLTKYQRKAVREGRRPLFFDFKKL